MPKFLKKKKLWTKEMNYNSDYIITYVGETELVAEPASLLRLLLVLHLAQRIRVYGVLNKITITVCPRSLRICYIASAVVVYHVTIVAIGHGLFKKF